MKPLHDPALELYAHDHTTPRPALFDALREETERTQANPQMQVGRVEGALLKLLAATAGAKSAIEIGTFTGYSGLCIAEGLAEGGKLITCDIDPAAAAIAQRYFDQSPFGSRIEMRVGDALETIRSLPQDLRFDFVFIDADKERYTAYFDALASKMVEGGLIVADNVLWSGSVLAPETDSARAIVAFNRHVTADPRFETVLLTVRDGVLVARKR